MNKKITYLITSLLVAVFSSLLFSGCRSTSSFVSNNSDKLKGPYKKIFIAIHSNNKSAPFTVPWMENVSKAFKERNILVKTYVTPDQDNNSLSLQSDSTNAEVDAQIKDFQPEVVMVISPIKVAANGDVQDAKHNSNGGTFDMKLFEPGNMHTAIWKGKMRVWGDDDISLTINKSTQNFISKLEKDNIITQKN
jgi:hypothetical protein